MKKNHLGWGLLLSAMLSLGAAQNAFALHIGLVLDGSTANANPNITFFVAEHPGYTMETITDVTVLNAMSVAEMNATYDLLVVPWQIRSVGDFDWDTRILPYLTAGGTVLWEDPTNVGDGDLDASGISLTSSTSIYPGISGDDITLVPPFDSNGAIGWYHIHFGITGHDSTWLPFSTDIDGGIHGVYGEFGAGRMIVGVSDNLYHPLMSDTVNPATVGAYNLLVNEIFWLGSGSVDDDPTIPGGGEPVPVPTLSNWALIGLALLMSLVGIVGLQRRKLNSHR